MTKDFDARNADRGRAVPRTCRTCEHYDRRESICKSYDLVIELEEDDCCDWKEASCTGTEDLDARNEKKSRAVCAAMADAADTGKRALTERERQILDMWPRFEDGEPVMPGDKVHYVSTYHDETEIEVESITVMDGFFVLCDDECRSNQYELGQRVKRPEPEVLDADGVKIKVGDTVWTLDGLEGVVTKVEDGAAYIAYESDYAQREEAANLTHTRPDSWERLEEDASKEPCFYFGFDDKLCSDGAGCPANKSGDCSKLKAADLIRRAKALAGVEVE